MSAGLHVYLDQNHWIYLGRMHHQPSREGKEFITWLDSALDNGLVILPLSFLHTIELLRAENPGRRKRLAEVFERFGRGWFIASWPQVLQTEIARAVRIATGSLSTPIPPLPELFGRGFGFVFGHETTNHQEEGGNEPEMLALLRYLSMQPGALLDLVTSTNESNRNMQNASIGARNRSDAALTDEARRRFRNTTRAVHRRAKVARYLLDHQNQIMAALLPKCLSFTEFLALGPEPLLAFVANIPTLDVDCELTLYRDRQWSRPVEPNDFADIGHLVLALPYCSAVVVERFWASGIRQAKLADKYSTQVFVDLRALREAVENGLGVCK